MDLAKLHVDKGVPRNDQVIWLAKTNYLHFPIMQHWNLQAAAFRNLDIVVNVSLTFELFISAECQRFRQIGK